MVPSKLRDAAMLSVPAVILAAPVLAESLNGSDITLPSGFDGSSAIVVLALYIIREQHVRMARIAESLASRIGERKSTEE